MSQKSILEQALLQVQNLEEAVKQNAKGILASTMKQELNDLLKESMEEEEETPKEEETNDMPDVSEDEETDDESETETDDETGNDDEDLDNDSPDKDIDSMDSDMDSDMDSSMDDMPSDDMSSDDDVMDMTGASHDEVLKVFKAMKPEDGIVVKKDGDEIEFSDGEDEYIIKLDEEGSTEEEMDEMMSDTSMEEDMYQEEMSEEEMPEESEEEESTIYEIELDEESEEEPKEEEFKESARTQGNGYHGGIESKMKYYAGNKREMNEEVEKLKKQNSEYKKALGLFKEKLNEVAVFNANLAYATRLFTENSTTKQEKLNILKRFDSVSTMNESKNLFTTINNELVNKKPITETIAEKISTTPTSSSSKEVLAESKAYENPQFKRMKDLMSKIK
jgi:hypothetical protein